MNIASNDHYGQQYSDLIARCPDDPVEATIWFFENADPLPGIPDNRMRGNLMVETNSGQQAFRLLTLLRSLRTDEPCGLHVSDTILGQTPRFSFVGDSVNTYALVGSKDETQFFVEPNTDVSLCIFYEPRVTFAEFHAGTVPPLMPEATSVWTRQPAVKCLEPSTVRLMQEAA